MQDIDVHGEYEKRVVTLLVMSGFSDFPSASRACAYFRDPTEDSRVKGMCGDLFNFSAVIQTHKYKIAEYQS